MERFSKNEYVGVINKLEELYVIGVKKRLCKPYDLSSLKTAIESLQTGDDHRNFEEDGFLGELLNLTRLCGSVCSKFVIKPGTILQFYTCPNCPIFKLEERYLN